MMQLALFGGSFDPPHRGHLAIARAAIARLGLHRVLMAPAALQPLKLAMPATSYADRLAMVRLAVAGDPHITASELDAPRSDGRPNFTIDVVTSLRATLGAEDRLSFLFGADAFLSLPQWHRAAELLFACDLIVASRPDFAIRDVPAALPEGVVATRIFGHTASAEVLTWRIHDAAGEQSMLHLMPDLDYDVAATDIRAAIAGEESADGVLCPAVLAYIEQRGLYR